MRLDLYANENVDTILAAVGLARESIPRFRGAGIEDGLILVHTRTGGGNREYYEKQNAVLQSNKYYIKDADDEFDCTYANFWFNVPDSMVELLKK